MRCDYSAVVLVRFKHHARWDPERLNDVKFVLSTYFYKVGTALFIHTVCSIMLGKPLEEEQRPTKPFSLKESAST
jgi:hypothetical protein